jgi:hypothetical protein
MSREDLPQSRFGASSTAAEVVAGVDLSGQTAIVTGGASGKRHRKLELIRKRPPTGTAFIDCGGACSEEPWELRDRRGYWVSPEQLVECLPACWWGNPYGQKIKSIRKSGNYLIPA